MNVKKPSETEIIPENNNICPYCFEPFLSIKELLNHDCPNDPFKKGKDSEKSNQ